MKKHIHHVHIIIILGILGAVFLSILLNIQQEKASLANKTTFGVSFTPRYAQDLGLDPKQTYQVILTDLKVRNIRLSAYWDEIEPIQDTFYFDDLDWYIDQATQVNASVILVIGYKLPRWPECRTPSWLTENLRERQLIMLDAVILHYDKNPTITAFQLENEPLLTFGICPPPDRQFLTKEVTFVKSQTKKPIILTDSGELRPWKTPMQQSDIFGTTLYRVVENPWFGPFQYPLRPWFYRVKSDLIRKIFAPNNQRTIISELQAEPWAIQPLTEITVDEQINRFSMSQFMESIDFARKTGFDSVYLWGAEWWYYMDKFGHPEYLQYSKTLF